MKYDDISIRSIQHYLYCPHRWGLMEIGDVWAENYYVTKGNLLHNRVNDAKNSYYLRGTKRFLSVPVYNDIYGLYGIIDCLEGVESPDGVEIHNKKYNLTIVEYKPTKPKNSEYHREDMMQVFAQKLCVDSIFNCKCDSCIYYADIKQRITLPLNENYDSLLSELKIILSDMRAKIAEGKIPEIREGQNCNGCSLKDICIPKIKKIPSVSKSILDSLKNNDVFGG